MKKTLIACAALVAACGGAQAQSVNIAGTLDLSVRHVNNGAGSLTTLSNNGISTSKIQFNGEEDLGGGSKAIFWLESQVDPDVGNAGGSNGTGTAFWNRRSTIALNNVKYGEVRLGRDYVPTHSLVADIDPHNTNGVGNALNLLNQDNLGSSVVTQVRANNAVSYFLPGNLGGVFGQFMVAPGEGLTGQQYNGARLGWASQALKVQVAVSHTSTATSDRFKQSNVGATYDFGFAKLGGFVNLNQYGQKKALVYLVGAVVPVGAAGEIRTAYEHRNASGAGTDANDAEQYTIAYWHKLSKRTVVYTNLGRLSNKGAAAYVQSGGAPVGTRTGFGSTGFDVGVRTFF